MVKEKNHPRLAVEEFARRHPEVALVPSGISDQDIAELEGRLGVSIPGAVRDYLQGYALSVPFVTGRLLGDFSQTFCPETGRWRAMEPEEEIATAKLTLPLMPPDASLRGFEESNRLFMGTGFLYLGLYNDEKYILLDLSGGQVYQAETERVRPLLGAGTREDILRWGFPFFESFRDLTRCFFADELYDEDEMVFVEE